MIIWKDATKYKLNEEHIPRVWETKVGSIRVVVRRYAGKGNTWFAAINDFEINHINLQTNEAQYAKARSLVLLQGTVEARINKLTAVLEEICND